MLLLSVLEFHLVWPERIKTLLQPLPYQANGYFHHKCWYFHVSGSQRYVFRLCLIGYTPIPHFWGDVSVFSWQMLSRTAFPFNAVLKPRALQFVCFWQTALDDVSLEKNPSGHLLQTVSLSGVPVETRKKCTQLHVNSSG